MEHILKWLWLTSKETMNPMKITCLLEYFKTIEEIYEEDNFSGIDCINSDEVLDLRNKDMSEAEKIFNDTKDAGAEILVYDDKNFPHLLRNIMDPPYVLYVKGEIFDWSRLMTIAVVGTRKNTDYGKLVTMRLASDMAKRGVTIVSGMALGIDALAQWAAIRAGGKVIAVIGSGIDVIYPPQNEKLYNTIIKHGVIITEYPPGSRPLAHHFPERNRIIAGICSGVVVVEAPKRSGSLITARQALDNGRDVFAVPGNVLDEHYAGSNRIIQSGAKLVMNAEDILEEYPYAMRFLENTPKSDDNHINNIKQISIDDQKYRHLRDDERKIIELLIKGKLNSEEISSMSGMSVSELNMKLSILEMNGMIKKLPGNNYQLEI